MTVTTTQGTDEAHWLLCQGCTTPLYRKRWTRGLKVCPECGHHARLTAHERLEQLADPGTLELLASPAVTEDVLGFVDTVAYPVRLADARARTGLDEAVVCARAAIGGHPLVVAAMDFRFMGGSLGVGVGQLITDAAETAQVEQLPLLIVTSSGGARMQEGALSLMQMARTSAALGQLDEAGLLTISLITDPTYGGVAASFATLADVIVAEPGARLGFAGRRVIEQTIHQVLPERFQTAEFLLERGFVDLVVPRDRLRAELSRLLGAASAGPHEQPRNELADPTVSDPGLLPESDPWEQVRLARRLDRPTTLDYLATGFTDFQELHGDRLGGDCPAVVGGTARLDGRPVMVIGHQKGHTAAELNQRNFGMPGPDGYRKAARLMRLADKLGLPVVTLIDTPGAYPGADAEERGQAVAIAENLRLMAGLEVPVVAVIIGEGGSGGALALAVANRVLIFGNGVYSVISPEGCAAILWKDPAAAPRAAAMLGGSARDLLRLGIVDGVVPEPKGGTGTDPLDAADRLCAALVPVVAELSRMSPRALVADRRERFRGFGTALTVDAGLPSLREVS